MEKSAYSEMVQTLLHRRGVDSDAAIEAFLNPDYDAHTHSPMLLLGMDKALARLFAALDAGERIAVYADFDCDGIPGAAVLSDFFTKVGHLNFEVYLPHRDREGYGFHTDAIAQLAERGVKLIITVDVGTTAIEAVRFAKKLGVDVIVTDHHEITGALPKAVVVLNPKLGSYPFPHLCGAAMAFKLVQAALEDGRKRGVPAFAAVPIGWEKWLLDLVGIATIADMVPLTDENRALAHFGLAVLRKSRRKGIMALATRLRLKMNELTEDDIGFSLAPRINAASRMDEPDLALRLLTTTDEGEAEHLAAHLEKLNASRKGVVSAIVRQARKAVSTRYRDEDRVVVLGNTEWKPALLGLAANSIMEERGGVVCMWGRDALGRLKGSCRSDGSVSLVELFANAGDVLEESGGHEHSGGFSVSHEHVHTLPDVMKEAASHMPEGERREDLSEPDLDLTLARVSRTVFADVTRLAPFGMGNPKPVFRISDIIVTSMKRFGKEQNHVELTLECRESGARCRAFDFFRSPEDFTHTPSQGAAARVLVTIERDTFRGGLALRIIDVVSPA